MIKLTSVVFAALMAVSSFTLANTETDVIIESATEGDPSAQLLAGDIYAFAEKGVKQDYKKALEWYGKSAEQGNATAKYNMAVILMAGAEHLDQEKSKTKAVELFKEVANEEGFGKAQFNLGVAYLEGDGVKRDETKANEWFKKACDNGIQAGCVE